MKHLEYGSVVRAWQWPTSRIIHTTTNTDTSTAEKVKPTGMLRWIINKLKFIDYEGAVSYNSLINLTIFKFL